MVYQNKKMDYNIIWVIHLPLTYCNKLYYLQTECHEKGLRVRMSVEVSANHASVAIGGQLLISRSIRNSFTRSMHI